MHSKPRASAPSRGLSWCGGDETVGPPSDSARGNDLLIAAHGYATGATIVTANADEFRRIRGLKVENWLP
jgi:predicted nucleic acid-binding protein